MAGIKTGDKVELIRNLAPYATAGDTGKVVKLTGASAKVCMDSDSVIKTFRATSLRRVA